VGVTIKIRNWSDVKTCIYKMMLAISKGCKVDYVEVFAQKIAKNCTWDLCYGLKNIFAEKIAKNWRF
jgi:hypothetical protein